MDDEGAKATVKDEGVTNISSSIDNVDFNKNNDKLKECLAGEEVWRFLHLGCVITLL